MLHALLTNIEQKHSVKSEFFSSVGYVCFDAKNESNARSGYRKKLINKSLFVNYLKQTKSWRPQNREKNWAEELNQNAIIKEIGV
jgi:hypothetical protein